MVPTGYGQKSYLKYKEELHSININGWVRRLKHQNVGMI